MDTRRSQSLFHRASMMPGGVNSPVRAFKSVAGGERSSRSAPKART